MTTLKQFKEWLDQFPDDTLVEVGVQEPGGNWEAYGPINFKSPELISGDIGEGWEFTDFRGNKFVKPTDERFNKCILRLGESA